MLIFCKLFAKTIRLRLHAMSSKSERTRYMKNNTHIKSKLHAEFDTGKFSYQYQSFEDRVPVFEVSIEQG